MRFFFEVRSIYRFFKKTPLSEKRIVFYAEHSGYYPYFEGLIDELTDRNQETISYITSEFFDPILVAQKPRLKAYYINLLLPLFMLAVDCRVFVMTLTDLNQFYLKRSLNPVHYVYVFHSLVSTHMVYRRGAFDHYDSILCVGPHQIREIQGYEKLENLKPKKLVEAGYYRLERIYKAYKDWKLLPAATGPKIILVAPSWGAQNILESCGEVLITILLKTGYKVIVRPHPETVKRNFRLIARLDAKFGSVPSFKLEKTVATDESLLKADVLISDFSGIALEYAFGTERPVLFIDVPPKVKNQRFQELGIEPIELEFRPKLGRIVSAHKLEKIPVILKELVSKTDDFRRNITELRARTIFSLGESSGIGAQHILNLL